MGAHSKPVQRKDRYASTVSWLRAIDVGDALIVVGFATASFIAWVLFSEMARWRW